MRSRSGKETGGKGVIGWQEGVAGSEMTRKLVTGKIRLA